jgi:DNA-binding XRE family transcriptional regulator
VQFSLNVPKQVHFHSILTFPAQYSRSGTSSGGFIMDDGSALNRTAAQIAAAFGALIRSRRKGLNLRQDQLALVTGVGRRFLIDLEGGKPSCQLGRSLLVAEALGIKVVDMPIAGRCSETSLDLPDLPEESEEPDGECTGLL